MQFLTTCPLFLVVASRFGKGPHCSGPKIFRIVDLMKKDSAYSFNIDQKKNRQHNGISEYDVLSLF